MQQMEKSSKACLLDSRLCPIISGGPTRICVPPVCAFSLPVNFLLYTFEVPDPRFPFLSRMAYKPQLPNLSSSLMFLWNLHMHTRNKFGHCLLLTCLMLIWLLVYLEELGKMEDLFFTSTLETANHTQREQTVTILQLPAPPVPVWITDKNVRYHSLLALG